MASVSRRRPPPWAATLSALRRCGVGPWRIHDFDARTQHVRALRGRLLLRARHAPLARHRRVDSLRRSPSAWDGCRLRHAHCLLRVAFDASDRHGPDMDAFFVYARCVVAIAGELALAVECAGSRIALAALLLARVPACARPRVLTRVRPPVCARQKRYNLVIHYLPCARVPPPASHHAPLLSLVRCTPL